MPFASRKMATAGGRPAVKPVNVTEQHVNVPQARQVQTSSHAMVHAAAASEPEGFQWGADMKNLGIAVGVGALLYVLPSPSGVTAQAWHLLAIFVGTIIGIITQPLPLGAVAMIGLGVSMVSGTLNFAQAFMAFSSQIPCAPLTLPDSRQTWSRWIVFCLCPRYPVVVRAMCA